MRGRLAQLAARPLARHERHGLFALTTAVILCAAALLLTLPPRPQPHALPPPAAVLPVSAPPADGAPRANLGLEQRRVEGTVRRFLRGYLRFLYGRGPAAAIQSTTGRLRRRLGRERLRVPPAAQHRHPRVTHVELRSRRGDRVVVTVEIDDGGAARYPIGLGLTRRHGRWLVSEIADH